MASKKDFSSMDTGNAGKLQSTIAQATSKKGRQRKVTEQEAAERAAKLETQGRKGCKAKRINMAFTPENYDFIVIGKNLSGGKYKTMTQYVNHIIEVYRTERQAIYEQAKAFRDEL